MSKAFSRLLKITLSTLGCFAINDVSQAQVTPDNTLNTRVNRNGNVSEITGGDTRGGNLFHSFQDFSVPTGDTASFNNAEAIENIFSRVTGGNISNIDGLIRANGSASLFLINPAGIVFGENARLDLGGSFYGSTADSILFEDGVFSASDLENPPLLTINAPIGLNFRDNPGEIINRANFGLTRQTLEQFGEEVDPITNITGLEVNPGQNLALIGGNITLIRSGITAPGSNITLGGLSQAGTVAIAPNGIFTFPENAAKADLSLENNALVSIIGNNGRGAINVDVGNLTLKEQSQLRAGIAEGAGDSQTVAGDITINASDSVTLIGNGDFEDSERRIDLDTAILNTVGLSPERVGNSNDTENTEGSSGSIFIDTKALEIVERGVISTRLYGVGNAGDININADTVLLDEGTITSQVGFKREKGTGNSGDININSNNFTATNSTFVITDNSGTRAGNAGDINLNATDSVVIRDNNFTAFISETGDGTVGNTGDINIAAERINFENNVQLSTQIGGRGNGGSINLEVAESLAINGGANLLAQVLSGAEGTAGNIQISTATLELIESEILTQNKSIGDAENIIIQANESIFASDSEIISQIEENGVGNAGDIKITADSLNLENNARLLTQVKGRGNAGNINLDIANSLIAKGNSNIQAQIQMSGEGEGGNIQIDTATIELIDNAQLLTDSRASGDSGEIAIRADESVFVSNGTISTGTVEQSQGNSGRIEIVSPQIVLTDTAIISSTPDGQGATADIDINTETLVLDEFSLITASSRSEDSRESGNININADRLTLTNGSIISATTSSPLFNGGKININARILELFSGGVLLTATDSDGNAGDIDLNISDGIFLDGNNAPNRPEGFRFAEEDLLNDREGETGIFANVSDNIDTFSGGGSIFIDSDYIVAYPDGNSDITANARQGRGGNITIDAELFGIEPGPLNPSTNDINASSEVNGLDGNVVIRSLDRDSIGQPREIPSSVVEVEQTTAQVCRANREAAAKNAFTIEGRGGVRPTPDSPLDSDNILLSGDEAPPLLRDRISESVEPQPIETSRGKIQPVRGIKVTKSGDVILTAYRTNNAGERIPERHNCG